MNSKEEIEIKNKQIDSLQKEADVIYKKVFVLLATAGGSGAYCIKFFEDNNYIFSSMFGIVFIFMTFGIGLNYGEINKIRKKIKGINNE